jgi:hypothetical protein
MATVTTLKDAILWWDSLTLDQKCFITNKFRPGWTHQMLKASSSTLIRCFEAKEWDKEPGFPNI